METDILIEKWHDIRGYEGLYQISNLGRVKSVERTVPSGLKNSGYRTVRERIKRQRVAENGYCYVLLWKNGKSKLHLIHRLVAEAFVPNPDNLPQVNHKDENKLKNIYTNLEWCTAKYNINYGTGTKKRSYQRSKKLYQLSKDGEVIKIWSSTHEVHKQTGYSQGNISSCCIGNRKTAYGYIWKYA